MLYQQPILIQKFEEQISLSISIRYSKSLHTVF